MRFGSMAVAAALGLALANAAQPQGGGRVRVRVELIDVHCRGTEDVTGADHFYIVAHLVGDVKDGFKGKVTQPLRINDGEKKSFPEEALFDGTVPANGTVVGALKAFEEDQGGEWRKKEKEWNESFKKANGKLGKADATAPTLANPGQLAHYVGHLADIPLATLDQDDKLGVESVIISAKGPAEETKKWEIREGGRFGLSTWDYTVRYRIVRIKE